jgi:hypothetical protein
MPNAWTISPFVILNAVKNLVLYRDVALFSQHFIAIRKVVFGW